jgi:uncharacterized membrane protein YjfL (UPF0719 family)
MKDPRNVWQSQPTEKFKLSEDDIRRKAQKLQSKARWATLGWITIGLALAVGFARSAVNAREVLPRVGWGMLSLWGIYGAYQAVRWIWPRRLQPDASAGTCLEFYRNELERQRDYGRHIWRRSGLTFCFLGLAIVLVPALIHAWLTAPRLVWNAAPFFVLLAIWFAIFFPLKKRKQQTLQQDIDELREFERGNRS